MAPPASSRYDLNRVEEVFPSASYQYVLYGMGFRPDARPTLRRADDADRADGFFREAAALTGKMLGCAANEPRPSPTSGQRAPQTRRRMNKVLLNNIDQGDLRVITTRGAAYGDDVMFAATFPAEFRNIQAHYPIVFHKTADGQFQSVALFGFQDKENLFLGPAGGTRCKCR